MQGWATFSENHFGYRFTALLFEVVFRWDSILNIPFSALTSIHIRPSYFRDIFCVFKNYQENNSFAPRLDFATLVLWPRSHKHYRIHLKAVNWTCFKSNVAQRRHRTWWIFHEVGVAQVFHVFGLGYDKESKWTSSLWSTWRNTDRISLAPIRL